MAKLKGTIARELSEKITELIGYCLDEDRIHHVNADGSCYHYYIRRLKSGYPVLAMHYHGPLVLLLPFEDFRSLDREEITVDDYIATSHFNYGYYWGGGGMISGGYWQPLEDGTGIHNTARIGRYLRILACRTSKVSCGYGPTEERCQKCQLDATTCPFSPLNQTGSWDSEVPEPDGRKELFKAIDERLKRELGFEWSIRQLHDDDKNELRLYPGWEPDTVEACVNSDLLNDLLYHPDREYDWQKMANDFAIAIMLPSTLNCRAILPNDATMKRELCLRIWCEKVELWEKLRKSDDTDNTGDPVHDNIETSPETDKNHRKRNIFAKIFGRNNKG